MKNREKNIVIMALQIMTTPVETLAADLTIAQAIKQTQRHAYRHMPIISKEGKVIGIISDRDLLHHNANSHRLIREIMTKDVLCSKADTEIQQIAKTIVEERVGAMPVIDADGPI